MTVKQLFSLRVKNGWHYHYKAVRTAIDWTVFVYIVIPILAIALYHYFELVQGKSEWVALIPIELTWLALLLVSWTGMIRVFLERGDMLFIRQHLIWYKGLLKHGIWYSVKGNTLFILFIFAILAPLWFLYYSVSLDQIIVSFLFSFLFRLFIQFLRQLLALYFQTWKLVIMTIILFFFTLFLFGSFIMNNLFIQILIICFLTLSFLLLYKKRLSMPWAFYEDCLREEEQRLKVTNFLVGMAGYKVEKQFFKRKKPIIFFPNSMHIFKGRTHDNILTEMFIKFFFRSKTRVALFLKLVGLFSFALTKAPLAMKWLLLIVCSYFIIHYVTTTWKELYGHNFFKLYPFSKPDTCINAIKRGILFITLPISFLFGLVAGVSVFSLVWAFFIAVGTSLGALCIIKKYIVLEVYIET